MKTAKITTKDIKHAIGIIIIYNQKPIHIYLFAWLKKFKENFEPFITGKWYTITTTKTKKRTT